MHENRSTVLRFVEYINSQDLQGLASLTADQFTFTDSSGRVYVWSRQQAVQECWVGYFTPFPDYKIHVQQVLTGGDGVAIIGQTSGSHMPADIEARSTMLWIAELQDGLVCEWRIYATDEYRYG
jgi:ketosteroid isomerase-like protein